MPQRFLRPGLRNSDRWNAVDWPVQSLYIRVLTLVDDYGRYDGRPSVLFGECFSVWNEKHPASQVSMQQVEDFLQQLAAENLIELYDAEGKRVLQITQWQERIRNGVKEKWPAKPKLQQVAASCSILLPSSPSSSPSSPSSSSPSSSPAPSSSAAVVVEHRVPATNHTNHTPPEPEKPEKRVSVKEVINGLPNKRAGVNGTPHLELMQSINGLYHRPETQAWSYEEQHLIAQITRRPAHLAEWSELVKYRRMLTEKRWFPQSVRSLLSKWDETLDKARGAARNPSMR